MHPFSLVDPSQRECHHSFLAEQHDPRIDAGTTDLDPVVWYVVVAPPVYLAYVIAHFLAYACITVDEHVVSGVFLCYQGVAVADDAQIIRPSTWMTVPELNRKRISIVDQCYLLSRESKPERHPVLGVLEQ